MNDYNLVLAINSNERIQVLKKHYTQASKSWLQIVKEWRKRKTIVDDDRFDCMLLSKEITKHEFGIGIKKLNKKDISLLYQFIQSQEWYRLHREILTHIATSNEPIDDGFRFFARPYLYWLRGQLETAAAKSQIMIEEKVIDNYLKAALAEIVEIVKKTIVYDHAEEYEVQESGRNWFLVYSEFRFSDRNHYDRFFNDYPVLARLLATRIKFTIDNFYKFINAIDKSQVDLKKSFNLKGNFTLQNSDLNKGDSHSKGKSVILFTLNGIKLVFKYKSLEIGNKLNQFYSFIETFDSSISFYKLKRIISIDYTIEEFVEHKPCKTIGEVRDYYRRFGQVVCISYALCGNDLHLENLVSSGSFPVIIDVETFLQNVLNTRNDRSAIQQYIYKTYDSILGTSLLPNAFGDREGKKRAEISALSGDECVIPNVLQLMEDGTGKMRMEYCEQKLEGAENLPILNEKKVNYFDYREDIIQGFTETYELIISQKENIKAKVNELFSGQLVRNVLKATQKYSDMLDYAGHPRCMTNYINREWIFENIWAYPYNNLSVINYEINDLLVNDIPIFYNRTNERDLITSGGEVLPCYYQITAMENVMGRIDRFSKAGYAANLNNLYIALGMFQGETVKLFIEMEESGKTNSLKKAKQITDYICKQVVWSVDKQKITLPAYITNDKQEWNRAVMTYSYYDGLAGFYLLLLQLVKYYPERQYIDLLTVMDNMFYEEIKEIKSFIQFADYLSLLYVICCKLERIYNIKDILTGKKLLAEMEVFCQFNDIADEWLSGKAGLIKICLKFYRLSGLKESFAFAIKLSNDIKIDLIEEIGFAHGYSGIIYSLACLTEYTEGIQLKNLIKKINYGVEQIEMSDYMNSDSSWCNGLSGIFLMQLKLSTIKNKVKKFDFHLNDKLLEKILTDYCPDDCLCHGNMGLKCALGEAALQRHPDENTTYSLRGLPGEPTLDLFTGLAGIAYAYLRETDGDIPNVLVLE